MMWCWLVRSHNSARAAPAPLSHHGSIPFRRYLARPGSPTAYLHAVVWYSHLPGTCCIFSPWIIPSKPWLVLAISPQERTTLPLRRCSGRTPPTISIMNRSPNAVPHRRRSRTCTHASTLTVSQLSGSPSNAPPNAGWSRWLLVLAGMLFTTVVGLVRPPPPLQKPHLSSPCSPARRPYRLALADWAGAHATQVMSSLFAYRMELLNLLQLFCTTLPTWGLAGILAFVALYATLELISVPVLPLTASAGAIWGACARAETPQRAHLARFGLWAGHAG